MLTILLPQWSGAVKPAIFFLTRYYYLRQNRIHYEKSIPINSTNDADFRRMSANATTCMPDVGCTASTNILYAVDLLLQEDTGKT